MKNCDICGAPNGNHVFPCRIVKKADQVANTEGSLRGSDPNETTGNKSASVTGYVSSMKIGDYSICWLNEDYILITGLHGSQVKIAGGDMESILSGMTGIEIIT